MMRPDLDRTTGELGSVKELDVGHGVALVSFESGDRLPSALIRRLSEAQTVLVSGPLGECQWREQALAAGAFACLSAATPAAEKAGFYRAAAKHQAAQSEIRRLRHESERICHDLVHSFGSAMERLSQARQETGKFRGVLEDTRLRIVRTLL